MTAGEVVRREPFRDVLVAALAAGGSLAIVAAGGFGATPPTARPLDLLGVVLLLAAAAPLVVRRRAPLAAYLVTGVATVATVSLGYPLDVPLAVVVAGYALGAAYGGAGRAVRLAAVAAVAAFVPVIAAGYAVSGYAVRGILPELTGWLVLLAGVWIAGDRARLRRERVAELEERAQRAAREAERERRVAAAEERLRIARELHDSAGHAINVILVQAGAARLLHERDPAGSLRAISTIEEVARTTIGEIDGMVRALRDGRAAPEPAPADLTAIDDLLARHRAAGLRLHTRLPAELPHLPPSVARAAYRIVQEALTNAARHGSGSAELVVGHDAGAVEITVTNPLVAGTSVGPGGHGLAGMRERALLVGGTLEARPVDGEFRVHARLPAAGVPAARAPLAGTPTGSPTSGTPAGPAGSPAPGPPAVVPPAGAPAR